MTTVKLSNKGQISIPKAMRDDLQLPPGTEFFISATPTGLSLTPKPLFPKTELSEVRGVLAKPGRVVLDDDEIKAKIKARLRVQDEASK